MNESENYRRSPDDLLSEAEQVVEEHKKEEYLPVIWKLREADMSWRKIADWLTERGVELTYSEVYYMAKKDQIESVPRIERGHAAQLMDEEAQAEAYQEGMNEREGY